MFFFPCFYVCMCCCEYSHVVLMGFAAATRGEWLGGELHRRWSKTVSPTPFILLLPLLLPLLLMVVVVVMMTMVMMRLLMIIT